MEEENMDNMSFEDKIDEHKQQWTNDVEELTSMLKTLRGADELLSIVTAKRQKILEERSNFAARVLLPRTMDYTKKYATLYNQLKTGQNNIRYTSDAAINIQIEAMLANEKYTIEYLNDFLAFLEDTKKSIDNIMYNINHKISAYKIENGIL